MNCTEEAPRRFYTSIKVQQHFKKYFFKKKEKLILCFLVIFESRESCVLFQISLFIEHYQHFGNQFEPDQFSFQGKPIQDLLILINVQL